MVRCKCACAYDVQHDSLENIDAIVAGRHPSEHGILHQSNDNRHRQYNTKANVLAPETPRTAGDLQVWVASGRDGGSSGVAGERART